MSTSQEAKKRMQVKSKDTKSKKWPIVLAIIGASIIVGGANVGTGYFIWSQTSSQTTPFIACSESGNLRTGATIRVTLTNGADWDNVSITKGEGWKKSTSHTFTKTNENAIADENVIITLNGGNAINLTISSGQIPDPTNDVYTMKTDGTDEYFNIDGSHVLTGWKDGAIMGNSDREFYSKKYTELIIPADITSIAENAFWMSASFRDSTQPIELKFNLQSNFTSIGSCAFYGCAGITAVDFSGSEHGAINYIGEYAFQGCELTSIIGGGSIAPLNTIGWGNYFYAFGIASDYGDPNWTSKTLYSQGCGCLAYGTFAPNIAATDIGPGAFEGCGGITVVDFSQAQGNFGSVGLQAFWGCALRTVAAGHGIEKVSLTGWGDNMNVFRVETETPYEPNYSNNVLYNSGCGCLAYGVFAPTNDNIIGDGALAGCSGITAVDFSNFFNIPDQDSGIGQSAFNFCLGIRSYKFASEPAYGPFNIGPHAFVNCALLGKVISDPIDAAEMQLPLMIDKSDFSMNADFWIAATS